MVATTFVKNGVIASLALHVTWAAETVERSETCETVCQHIQDPAVIGSIGSSIESSVSGGQNPNILLGQRFESCAGFHGVSALWSIWAKSMEAAYPSGVSNIAESGSIEDRVCIDKVALARLTAAASSCHSISHGSSSSSWSSHSSGGTNFESHGGSQGAGGNLNVQPGDGSGGNVHFDTSGGGSGSGSIGTGSGTGGGAAGGDGGSGSFGTGSGSGSGSFSGGGSNSGSSNINTGSGGSTSHTTNTWGHGNVNTDSICFRIKDKRSDRYLTSGGTEYAYAYYPNYYSVFRAYPSKSVAGGYTMTEINRSGTTVNYPVKLNSALGAFKPLYGDKDVIFTFSPANFGDSCWGVPGKKMSRRHDWGSWGDNYRQVSSGGEDCADIELEEADC